MDIMEGGARLCKDKLWTTPLEHLGQRAFSALSNTTNAAGGLEGIQGFVTRGLASKAVGIAGINITPAQILARSTGQILNPNMELLFNGPSLAHF